ncbi:MAG TPA: HAD family hydrolase [Thermoplasmata archaeon]|nr:HAD family hydrolase [Thermoplasmata archaeon]
MSRAIFLDLYGVLADSRVMERAYNERMAAILQRRHGGTLEEWRRLQLASYEWYLGEGSKLDGRPGPEREGDAWVEAVQRMNAGQILWMFDRSGRPPPEDPLRYSEDLETETVRGIDALFEDVHAGLRALKSAGHRLFLSTNANRSNAESALIGGGIRELFDGLLMLETARAKKDRPYYWRRAFEVASVRPEDTVVVDDVARFLEPASSLGARCIQLVRDGGAGTVQRFPVVTTFAAIPPMID